MLRANTAKTGRNLQIFANFAPCSIASLGGMHRRERRVAAASRDKFSFSYFAWVVVIFLLFASAADLDRIFNLRLLLVPLLVVPALAVSVGWTAALIQNVALRRWRRVISVLVAPVAACALFAAAGAAGVNPERIRLEIGRQYYLDRIAKLAQTDEPRLKLFDWGQTGGAGITTLIYTLVYDEADEISLPVRERSAAWKDRAGKLCPGTPMCAILWPPAERSIAVKKIQGHFYLVTEVF